ncbi:uncharacterized ABC transporter ATP-binding protein YbhF [Waddlia chondrophila 2032/99]|uniref:Uncharacterized ABC transporter ATP-binding protein YbhF n=1 Tax=Waddlia chondrophila 2032/99 TaxID=765953 RepID=F8LFA6_9BACT|nr:uncharacterized ABC transporter ATP-binding protein YbhF [Waddlia chondrophila 2032/99]
MSAVVIQNLTKTFDKGKRIALNNLCADFPKGKISGIVGPDGAGKTTLLRILAGLMQIDSGQCLVWDFDTEKEPEKIQESLGYLPQKFGLYEDLTVSQNLSLYKDLQEINENDPVFAKLMEFSGLASFTERLAGNLSGGMKQKLGLISILLRKPALLLLDEPTTGVDPKSQNDLWEMIAELNNQGMTIIASTSYLEEAEKCHYTFLLNEGQVLYRGTPSSLKETMKGKTFYFEGVGDVKRTVLDSLIGKNGIVDTIIEGSKIRVTFNAANPDQNPERYGLNEKAKLLPRDPYYEDAFISILGGIPKRPALKLTKSPQAEMETDLMIQAVDLSRSFGDFKAVNCISFSVKKGEIFGLLGPNGAGKSTTFKMLCGILPATDGEALVGGKSLRQTPDEARGLIGYMAQKFSLYNNMTVAQNLRFFSGIYPVKNRKKTREEMIAVFNLEEYLDVLTVDLPLGYKQRLAFSCALMHKPQILFLDEPTSGVDPLTRREFWHQINLLADAGVSILVSTHLMDEAEFCDRIGLIYKGALRIVDTPEGLKKRVPKEISEKPGLIDAFLYFCSEREER